MATFMLWRDCAIFENLQNLMEQKSMTFYHDFYVVIGKQCRTENAGHQHHTSIQIYFTETSYSTLRYGIDMFTTGVVQA